ncbi:serine/arginine repetitive matrix protein 1-like [Gigantopelta aegis]|uniref:serine/arginine repetitive matrix protein 1-like n=1 Tax=Gigantopelta aegis TaxID=1735272 RepID=UPI001B88D60B|nr:serine/arginine repetitive matrix protein 1-like [Gigantopelta aegis]
MGCGTSQEKSDPQLEPETTSVTTSIDPSEADRDEDSFAVPTSQNVSSGSESESMPRSRTSVKGRKLVKQQGLVKSGTSVKDHKNVKSLTPGEEQGRVKSRTHSREHGFVKSPTPSEEYVHVKSHSPRKEQEHVKSSSPSEKHGHMKSRTPVEEQGHVQSPAPSEEYVYVKSPTPRKEHGHVKSSYPDEERGHVQSPAPSEEHGHVKSPTPRKAHTHVKSPTASQEYGLVQSPTLSQEHGLVQSPTPSEKRVHVKSRSPRKEHGHVKSPTPNQKHGLVQSPTPSQKHGLVQSPVSSKERGLVQSPTPSQKHGLVQSPVSSKERGLVQSPTPSQKHGLVQSPTSSQEHGLVQSPTPSDEHGIVVKSPTAVRKTSKEQGLVKYRTASKEKGLVKSRTSSKELGLVKSRTSSKEQVQAKSRPSNKQQGHVRSPTPSQKHGLVQSPTSSQEHGLVQSPTPSDEHGLVLKSPRASQENGLVQSRKASKEQGLVKSRTSSKEQGLVKSRTSSKEQANVKSHPPSKQQGHVKSPTASKEQGHVKSRTSSKQHKAVPQLEQESERQDAADAVDVPSDEDLYALAPSRSQSGENSDVKQGYCTSSDSEDDLPQSKQVRVRRDHSVKITITTSEGVSGAETRSYRKDNKRSQFYKLSVDLRDESKRSRSSPWKDPTQQTMQKTQKKQKTQKEELYTDPEFPQKVAMDNVKLPDENYVVGWKRPGEIYNNPVLFSEKPDYNIKPYNTGRKQDRTSRFLSMVANLTAGFNWLVTQDHFPEDAWEPKTGVFKCRLFDFGQWETICTDDYLPVFGNKPVWGAVPHEELWVALIAKCFARLNGSYDSIIHCLAADAYVALTGGLADRLDYVKQNESYVIDRICYALQSMSVITCYSQSNAHGLVEQHTYLINGLRVVNKDDDKMYLLKMKNVFGVGEWTGPWSRGSEEWNDVQEDNFDNYAKTRMNELKEFWICVSDFNKYFAPPTICNPLIHVDSHFLCKPFDHLTTIYGQWKDSSNTCDIYFTVSETGMCYKNFVPMYVQLMQERTRRGDRLGIKCEMFTCNGSEVELMKDSQKNYGSGIQVSQLYKLQPNVRYMLRPKAYKLVPGRQFLIRLFTAEPLTELKYM